MKFYRAAFPVAGLAGLISASASVFAQPGISSCASIENAQARLECYDQVVEETRDLPVLRIPRNSQATPAAESNSESESVTEMNPRNEFGLDIKPEQEQEKKPEMVMPDSLTLVVKNARHNDFTGWTIEFNDGSTWKQVGTDSYRIRKGESYNVQRGALGSYFLSSQGNNRKIRVKRVE